MSDTGYSGRFSLGDATTPYNAQRFFVEEIIGRIATATIVKVISCTNSGGVSPIGTVDVQPAVNQIDGQGNPTAHGTIHKLPYLRIQGGANAVIIDPVAGDIGLAVFCSTDISAVKSSGGVSNPGSFRRYDWADGIYVGMAISKTTPTQYVQINSGGVTIVGTGAVAITGPAITLNGAVNVNGVLSVGGVVVTVP